MFDIEKMLKIKIRQKTKGLLSILGAFFIQMSMSCFFLWGTVCLYITSYLHHSGIAPEQPNRLTIIIVLLTAIGLQLGLPHGVNFANKFGLRATATFNTLAITGVVFLSAFSPSFYVFVLLNGLGFGFLMGINYSPANFNCFFYFPEKRALVSGLVFSGLPLGTFFANFVCLQSINPENVKPVLQPSGEKYFPKEVAMNLPTGMMYLSLTVLFFGLIGVLLSFPYKAGRKKPKTRDDQSQSSFTSFKTVELGDPLDHSGQNQAKELTQKLRKEEEEEEEEDDGKEEEEDVQNYPKMENIIKELKYPTVEDVKASSNFKLLLVMAFCSSAYSYLVIMNYKNYGFQKLDDDRYLTFIGSVSQLFNAFGRIFFGVLAIKMDLMKSLMGIIWIQVIFACTMVFIASTKELYFIWVIVVLIISAAHFTILPALSVEVFGMKSGRHAFSFIFMGLTTANCMQFFWCYFLEGYLGFDAIMFLYITFCVAGAILSKRMYDVIQRNKAEYREQITKSDRAFLDKHQELFDKK